MLIICLNLKIFKFIFFIHSSLFTALSGHSTNVWPKIVEKCAPRMVAEKWLIVFAVALRRGQHFVHAFVLDRNGQKHFKLRTKL
jgi:hypothetical protein